MHEAAFYSGPRRKRGLMQTLSSPERDTVILKCPQPYVLLQGLMRLSIDPQCQIEFWPKWCPYSKL